MRLLPWESSLTREHHSFSVSSTFSGLMPRMARVLESGMPAKRITDSGVSLARMPCLPRSSQSAPMQ